MEPPSTVPSINIVASLVRAHLDSNPTIEKLDYSKVNNEKQPENSEYSTNQTERPSVVMFYTLIFI